MTVDSLKALDKEGTWFHERAWRQLAESEMLGLAIPEEYGGAGMGLTELCILLQQVGRTVAPIPALRDTRLGCTAVEQSLGPPSKRSAFSVASRKAAPS